MFNPLSVLRDSFFPQWINRLKENQTISASEHPAGPYAITTEAVPTGVTQPATTFEPFTLSSLLSDHEEHYRNLGPTSTAVADITTAIVDSFNRSISVAPAVVDNYMYTSSSIAPVSEDLGGYFQSSEAMMSATVEAVAELVQNVTFLPAVTLAATAFQGPLTFELNATNNSMETVMTTENNYWALILVLFPVLTIFGNTLVILSVFREKSLQTATNYFIVSLACADLLVAAVVMPFAVYIEVNGNEWSLGNTMCDTWVATDVIASTCSIFNLTAISIDRYIAVTKPVKYARHKNDRRVVVTICVVWLVSVCIGVPMILGLNTGSDGIREATLCMFYNTDFIIYSSLSSFFIPCFLMIYLYWRIFEAIRQRAKKAKSAGGHKAPKDSSLLSASRAPSSATPPVTMMMKETSFRHLPMADNKKPSDVHTSSTLLLNGGDDIDDIDADSVTPPLHESESPKHTKKPANGHADLHHSKFESSVTHPSDGSSPDKPDAEETKSMAHLSVASPIKQHPKHHNGSPVNGGPVAHTCTNNLKSKKLKSKDHRRSMKSREKVLAQRERKATKTLAIVLGVFLACWVPFFTANMWNAILGKLDLPLLGPTVFMVTTWLGYGNSFCNPIIYTIFNEEFRKAFLNILRCTRK